MLVIKMTDNELKFFDDLRNKYPDNILIRTEHGFDMNSTVQITIDVADMLEVIIPSIIAVIELILLHRIEKRQAKVSEREVEVHEKELELEQQKLLFDKAKEERDEFEIRISSNGESEVIVKTSDVLALQEAPETLPQFIEKIRTAIGNKNETI